MGMERQKDRRWKTPGKVRDRGSYLKWKKPPVRPPATPHPCHPPLLPPPTPNLIRILAKSRKYKEIKETAIVNFSRKNNPSFSSYSPP